MASIHIDHQRQYYKDALIRWLYAYGKYIEKDYVEGEEKTPEDLQILEDLHAELTAVIKDPQ